MQPATVSCVKPDYLKAGDRVALISPSYYTPMENIEKTADVVRGSSTSMARSAKSQLPALLPRRLLLPPG